ncbi:hypothetical protein BDW02DRAFT_116305 [Decorospora gaudefroyi]|uniref:CFEM domain-containing protein n=1 Tax=Decorospora gaudefroyi TaxID=184978 RepID=A0A6A5K6I7_9PLEO|nr:hypothetical protein BDW02DRAFT_116305 [Decorospora gaudefroyi]
MLLSHSKGLCVSLVLLISALSVQAAPTVASTPSFLPQALQKAVPSCAQSCVRASLDERFPVACSGQEGIQCLCSRYSSMGESLGEVALGCIYLSCQTEDSQASLNSAYGVCLGQKEAVMPTKTALTYVVTGASRTMSTPSASSAPTQTQIITSTLQTQTSSTKSAVADSISVFPSATASASPSPATAAMAAEAPPKMTPAQIAGLSVAAVAAFVMAIGLMALSVCLRRRREQKFIVDSDEKGQQQMSARFSHYVPMADGPEPPKQFPLMPRPAVRKEGNPYAHMRTARPIQRPGVGTSNSSSESSLPLDQIGLAISAELDGKPLVPKDSEKPLPSAPANASKPSNIHIPFRPVSTMTQETVFEEDDDSARRRSSMLLPTPPVPIPPIRALQPSRIASHFATTSRPTVPSGRRSELFLEIPIRHERPQPRRVIAAAMPSKGLPQPPQPSTRPRLAPPFQMTSAVASYESKATTASSRDGSNSGDIIDYYFTSNLSQEFTPKASPSRIIRPKESPKAVQIKPKKPRSSTLSRPTSRTSTNLRDSLSSQTSFETVDPDDPTPEDEADDKQLSDDSSSTKQQLSPVAESPISKLRYPKVPRASNQLVPRSPKSPPNHNYKSPRRAPDPSTLLQKRNNALPPLLLESRPRLESPHRDPFTSPPRINSPARKPPSRSHMRSNSTESWSTTPASKTGIDRKSRVQSGTWGKSPIMYEVDVVKPLKVRRKREEMTEINIGRDVEVDAEGLRSPMWAPRLTPRRKGEDLFLEVGWGDGVMR